MSVLIIAEAGVNHNGSLARAKKMALAAKTAGADIVKYQTAVPELVVSKFAEKAEYQKAQTGAGESQLEMVRRIHFGFDGHRELKAYCEEIGIEYLSTPFDLDSIDFLASLELPVYKIPSGEITNLPYLERIAALKKPVILSTGMSTLAEIEDAMSVLEDGGVEDITLLHCNTEYPTPFADANLRAMQDLASHFGCAVGYSDHTLGWEADIAAVALGACVIEKHPGQNAGRAGPQSQPGPGGACGHGARGAQYGAGFGRRPQACDVQRGEKQGHCPQEHRGPARHRRGRGVHGGKPHHQASGRRRFAHALARGSGPNGQTRVQRGREDRAVSEKRGLRRRGAEAFIS